MIVTIEDKQIEVSEEVGKLINEAKAYRFVCGGMSPLELNNYLNEIAKDVKEIREKTELALSTTNDINKLLGITK